MYRVTIQAVTNGFVVCVGCKLFVSEKWQPLAEQLNAYFTGKETDFIKKQKEQQEGVQVATVAQPEMPPNVATHQI